MKRSRFFKMVFSVSALTLSIASGSALAQAWPSKPISLVVPFPAGGTTDVLARAVGQELSKSLGQPVVVESKPGAGATLGADYVAKSKADGYTLLMGAVHHTIASSVYKKLPYDFQKDLAPVTTVALVPNVLVINPNVAAKNTKELQALAKASPGKLTYGSNGNGTGQHLIGAQFEAMSGVELLHVPYKGSGPLTTDLLGGQIIMSFDTITPVLSHIKAGKLRALAVTSKTRSPLLPNTPTVAELGYPQFESTAWWALFAPAKLPEPIAKKLRVDTEKIAQSAAFKERLGNLGVQPNTDFKESLANFQTSEIAKWARVVRDSGATVD